MLHRSIKNIQYILRIVCGNSTFLSKLFKLPFTKRRSLVSPSICLCMEGFPRSGNTFLLFLYRYWNKDGIVCHHTHFPSQVISAVRMRKPCIVTIRMPKDAVTSMLMRHPELSVDLALWNYISYYQAIQPVIDRVILAPYEQIMDNPAQIFAAANKKYGSNISYGTFNADLREEFLNKLYRRHKKKTSPHNAFQPNNEKNSAKTEIVNRVMANKRFAVAESLYWELTNSHVARKHG